MDYKKIIRLSNTGYSGRQIAASLKVSRNSVSEVLSAAETAGLKWPLDEEVENAELKQLLFPQREKGTISRYTEPDYGYIHRELAKPGVTLTLLWNEYCEKCNANGKTPYMSTQFSEKYRRWARITKATMRIQHKPGDAMQVDWAGNTIPVSDPMTGDSYAMYLFVAVLPCSCYAYVEACSDMKSENWLLCHVNAYSYFGGVPRLTIPDNLKTGVVKNTRYETVLNRSYHELAEHYDTAIVPARVRHPQDKSIVEGTVRYISTWIIAALRDRVFFSASEVQTSVSEKLEELNRQQFQKRDGTRYDAYVAE